MLSILGMQEEKEKEQEEKEEQIRESESILFNMDLGHNSQTYITRPSPPLCLPNDATLGHHWPIEELLLLIIAIVSGTIYECVEMIKKRKNWDRCF